MVSLSRCTIVLAVPWLTPSASASSGPSRPCRNVRSRTARSRSDRPPATSATRSASSVRADSVSGCRLARRVVGQFIRWCLHGAGPGADAALRYGRSSTARVAACPDPAAAAAVSPPCRTCPARSRPHRRCRAAFPHRSRAVDPRSGRRFLRTPPGHRPRMHGPARGFRFRWFGIVRGLPLSLLGESQVVRVSGCRRRPWCHPQCRRAAYRHQQVHSEALEPSEPELFGAEARGTGFRTSALSGAGRVPLAARRQARQAAFRSGHHDGWLRGVGVVEQHHAERGAL